MGTQAYWFTRGYRFEYFDAEGAPVHSTHGDRIGDGTAEFPSDAVLMRCYRLTRKQARYGAPAELVGTYTLRVTRRRLQASWQRVRGDAACLSCGRPAVAGHDGYCVPCWTEKAINA